MTRKKSSLPENAQLISISTAAARIGINDRTLRKWVSVGRLPAYRVGPRLLRVNQHDVDAMVRRIPTVTVRVGSRLSVDGTAICVHCREQKDRSQLEPIECEPGAVWDSCRDCVARYRALHEEVYGTNG